MYNRVTISGSICSGKTTLFWDLYKKLNWPTFSAGHFFRDYARNQQVSLQKAEEQDTQLTKIIDYGMKELLTKERHIILEGWMAGIMANKLPRVLRVLLVADEKARIKRFAKREKCSIEQAKQKIKQRAENVFAKLEQIYGRSDFLDPKNYNLVIDTTDKKADEVLSGVLRKLDV